MFHGAGEMQFFRGQVDAVRRIRQSQVAAEDALVVGDFRRLMLNQYRRRLISGAGRGNNARIVRKRFARKMTIKLARKLRHWKIERIEKAVLLRKFNFCPILDALYPQRKVDWRIVAKRDRKAKSRRIALENFNFIDKPDHVLSCLEEISRVDTHGVSAYIDFMDEHCVDMGAYLVLAEVRNQMTWIFRGGHMPVPIQKVIEAVRLREPLGMRLSSVSNEDDVWAFPLRQSRPAASSRSTNLGIEPAKREVVADQFCDQLDGWLSEATTSVELSQDGRANFAGIITELLDNAERHSMASSSDGSWSLAAFMARRNEGGVETYRCFMAFLSVGQTMAEGLKTASPAIVQDMGRYCNMHKNGRQSPETLATLYALQDGVTRDQAAAAQGRGGIGFQSVLQFVEGIGQTPNETLRPRFTIVSGNSCVRLGDRYFSGSRRAEHGGRELWCNAQNLHTIAPDIDVVFDLKRRLAGTLVTLTFVLDGEFLRKRANGEN